MDSQGNILDFLLTKKRDAKAEKRSLRKALKVLPTVEPRVITVERKNPSYPAAIDDLEDKNNLAKMTELRQRKYLNNVMEQDDRHIKCRVKSGLRFASFTTARRTIRGDEAMNIICKGQVKEAEKGDVMRQISYLHYIFRVAV